jgi:cellulose synthase/poly-beta-1,6-N-acetylglucosamine synthase-like glycosyltransferase
VATIVDLEAGDKPAATRAEEFVPATQVRRLTATLVDILRQMAAPGQAGDAGGGGGGAHGREAHEGSSLLADTASEMSLDDKLSMSSGGGTSAPSARDSEISAATALLKAQYLPQQEYRGDDVRPYYCDLPSGAPPPADAQVADVDAACPLPESLKKRVRVNWPGLAVFLLFIGAFVTYVGIRAAKTLGLGGNLWYGVVVLAVEVLGGLAMLPYGLCLCVRVREEVPPAVAAAAKGQAATTEVGYHVRVMIPCYKEPLEVVSKTMMAALYAAMPANCRRTGAPPPPLCAGRGRCFDPNPHAVCAMYLELNPCALSLSTAPAVYLLDDGRDADKRQFVRSLGLPNAVYVSGRKRSKGEVNGKSANINNAARQIYPPGAPVPLEEVMCVFDADQVPNADFFSKMVPLLDGGRDVGMVLSPQTFYNLNADGDIFNHANVHFWDYTQPGYDALGLISCTGTNFLVRARAFQDAGLFPEWTLTEDFALGIELKRRGWQCRYVDEYLAVGEAPEEVRNCFQQRSRWAKGHFQVFFGRGRNPVAGAGAKGLSPLMRWMYGSVVLSYFSAFLGTPLLMLVPIVTVWFGAFPIVINFWAALSITIYYAATMALMYYTRSLGHLKVRRRARGGRAPGAAAPQAESSLLALPKPPARPSHIHTLNISFTMQSMWFAGVSNSILWFAFLKALSRATVGRWLSGTIVFKVTAKGLQRLNSLPLRDVWMSSIWLVFSLVTLIFGLVHFFKGGVLDTPLAISLIFMVYNLVPQVLLLLYAAYRPRTFFNVVCRIAMLLSTAMIVLGLVLVWVLYPKSYDYKAVSHHHAGRSVRRGAAAARGLFQDNPGVTDVLDPPAP